jgi:hypothetical protein
MSAGSTGKSFGFRAAGSLAQIAGQGIAGGAARTAIAMPSDTRAGGFGIGPGVLAFTMEGISIVLLMLEGKDPLLFVLKPMRRNWNDRRPASN